VCVMRRDVCRANIPGKEIGEPQDNMVKRVRDGLVLELVALEDADIGGRYLKRVG